MATLETPGTPIRRGRTFHRARVDRSMSETSLADSAIIMTRLVEEAGWIITGGAATLATPGPCARRSVTSCRARNRSVPGLKVRSMADRPGIDREWIWSRYA